MVDFDKALKTLSVVSAPPVTVTEHAQRVQKLAGVMRDQGVDALWLDASSSLTYYTGLSLRLSERIHGALVHRDGSLTYITPEFERPKLESMIRLAGRVAVWEEDETPFALFADLARGRLALDPDTPYRFVAQISAQPGLTVMDAGAMTGAQRRIKSASEIAIIQAAMDASYGVQKAVHAGLRAGMKASEVADFIAAAHAALGLAHTFAAVQFGEATAYPHGVAHDQTLAQGDMVLVDLGARLHGYHSDITRTYVFGTPTERQAYLWSCEHKAQQAGFAAAQPGALCEVVDKAARDTLVHAGFGPGYSVPGLPHRTGHGLGLDIHEEPWIVKGNKTPLEAGMCFSIEPMLCVYGECGVRLEDIAYMTDTGARWFCPPANRPDAP
ncbi:X-Pro dipeptidase (plasmid) [Gemmobacter aquarius]|uniref:X-Pro dipeptidase n=1 Tax=Paragemmobacter aquarius TaxID=2169400 RepID=A0A2S0URU7_9RHOB|nr:Xaa-Pro peptidase family protein [Gemmobacter aquarius]AWB50527.1 X-Pro dipeptidase [Gemmobacter aquarius]